MEVWARLPIFYFSNPLRVMGPEEVVPFPAATRQLDYECELAVIVAREGSNILEADADPYIAGFTIFNDWSCRDLQFDESTFGLGPAKGKDAASSLGPWIVTRDEMAPYYRNGTLHVQCTVRVNGVVWMTGNAWNMHHTFGAMLERAAQDSRIVPGDVIATGTVGGGSISEAVRKGFPRGSCSRATWSRWRWKASACCATRSGRRPIRTPTCASPRRRNGRCRSLCSEAELRAVQERTALVRGLV